MEQYIVTALPIENSDKFKDYKIIKDTDAVELSYKAVFGPGSQDACGKWVFEHEEKAVGGSGETTADTKALRPKVYTERDRQIDPNIRPDGFLQKIVKYIPSEIVAAYVAIANILQPPSNVANNAATLWWVFVGLLILTPFYTYVFAFERGKPRPIYQTVVAPIAFASWVLALPNSPFDKLIAAYHLPQTIGSIVLILVLVAIPVVEQAINVFRPVQQLQRVGN